MTIKPIVADFIALAGILSASVGGGFIATSAAPLVKSFDNIVLEEPTSIRPVTQESNHQRNVALGKDVGKVLGGVALGLLGFGLVRLSGSRRAWADSCNNG